MLSKVAVFDHSTGKFNIRDEKVDISKMPSSAVFIKHNTIALNEIDVADATIRNISNLGYTACGEVITCGADVNWLNPGDRVVYFDSIGAYRENNIVDGSKLIKLPDNVSANIATAVIYRGIVAHMALVRTFIVAEGTQVVVDGINTVTGAIMGWMAKKRGAVVVGITSDGDINPSFCDKVVIKSSKNIAKDVIDYYKEDGAHLYIATLKYLEINKILEILAPAGVILDSIGCITDITISNLMQKSLFITTPNMSHYKSLRTELVLTFDEIASMLNEKPLAINFSQYKFDQINEAFSEVSSGQSSSAVVLKI